MKYIKEANDFEQALSIDKDRELKIKNAIQDAYNQEWHKLGPNVDQIYALVAPFIETPEEGFYAASIILSDIFGAMQEMNLKMK